MTFLHPSKNPALRKYLCRCWTAAVAVEALVVAVVVDVVEQKMKHVPPVAADLGLTVRVVVASPAVADQSLLYSFGTRLRQFEPNAVDVVVAAVDDAEPIERVVEIVASGFAAPLRWLPQVLQLPGS